MVRSWCIFVIILVLLESHVIIDGHDQSLLNADQHNHIQSHHHRHPHDGSDCTREPHVHHHHGGDGDGINEPHVQHHHDGDGVNELHAHHHHDGDGGSEPHVHHHHDGDGGSEPHVHHHHGDEEHEDKSHNDGMASDVLVLDASNFTETVLQHPFIVVEFYAPWCGYCKRFAPKYEEAASLLRAHDPPIVLAKVDVTKRVNEDLADEFDIDAIPALKIIEGNGDLVREYEGGGDDAHDIMSYLKKQVQPASREILNAEQGHQLVHDSNNSITVVGVFSSYECEEFHNFSLVASELRSRYEFLHTLNADFLHPESAPLTVVAPCIRVFKNFDDEGFNDTENFERRSIKTFLEQASIPYVVLLKKGPPYKEHLSKIFAQREAILVYLFVDATVENGEIQNKFEELAKQYRWKGMWFLIADTEDGQRAFQFFGVKKHSLPCVVLERSDEKKYMLEKARPCNIEEWLKQYFDGKVSEFHKSESVPEKNDGLVKIVVLDTFDEMVLNSGKNVLVEFYAPWCAHCQRLAPIINEVAYAVQSNTDVLIAKYDATSNDIKDGRFDVRAFPTIYLHSASGKVIPYDGDLDSVEHLVTFINDNKDTSPGKGEIIKETTVLDNLSAVKRDEL